MNFINTKTVIASRDRRDGKALCARVARILDRRSLMAVVATMIMASPGLAHAQSASATDWRLHKGEGPVALSTPVESGNGNFLMAFDRASIPAVDDAGWTAAPDPKAINFGNDKASALKSDRCRYDVDYTYFETMVNIPAGTAITDFKIHFKGMDDASRITVFRPGDSVGQVVDDSYVRKGADVRSPDLKALVGEGDNRVVITQVDWCAPGNKLVSATVELNGREIEVVKPTETTVIKPPREDDKRPFLPASHGDVHIRTPDGIKFDFQATGDFILLQSTDGELVIQSRQEAWKDNPKVSVNIAAALNVAGVRVEYYLKPAPVLYIDGVETALTADGVQLANGGSIELDTSSSGRTRIFVYWPNGFATRLTAYPNNTMDIEVRVEISKTYKLSGLIGNLDGNAKNDFQTRSGEILPFPAETAEINNMGESWRVPQSESLFLKGGRPSSETPVGDNPLTLGGLDPAARDAARDKCAASGVTERDSLSSCTYDVAVTGDETFIASAQLVQEAVATIPAANRIADENLENLKAPTASAVESLIAPGQSLTQGQKFEQNGHHLIYQADGNLCVYTAAAGWVWCINNDPAVNYGAAATGGSVVFGEDGRLVVSAADGSVVWQAPAAGAQPGSKLTLTTDGALQIVGPNGDVIWSSKAQ